MSDTAVKDKPKSSTFESNIGKRYILSKVYNLENECFKFSSSLEEIGYSWDILIRNNTEVMLLSDPVIIERELYGKISVSRVMVKSAEGSMDFAWVRTEEIFPIDG